MIHLPHYRYDVAPGGSEPARPSPMLIFLHGVGECGSDLALVRRHGPPSLSRQHGLDRFLVVSPQCPSGSEWVAGHLDEFIRAAMLGLSVDPERVYLTGISMGGFGAWDLAVRSPELFAGVAVVCGGGDARHAARLATVPIWLVHSAGDRSVPVDRTDRLFDALRRHDADVTYTRYKRLGHVETWREFYGSRVLYDWFLQHQRPG